MIPYGRQTINAQDLHAVAEVLASDWLTQGPKVVEFEQQLARACAAPYAVSMANGTAALHATCAALGLTRNDWLWTSPISFVASANCARYLGAQVDFVDIDPVSRNMCPEQLAIKLAQAKLAHRLPKIVVVVHFAGYPCELKQFAELAEQYGFALVEDAAHAIGSVYGDLPIGSCQYSRATCFSFHPVKNLTTGEGGAVTTQDVQLADKIRLFCSHGITKNSADFILGRDEPWAYEQQSLGFNYRLTDIQAALGISQLDQLNQFVERRQLLFDRYQTQLEDTALQLPAMTPGQRVAWHIYSVRLTNADLRLTVFNQLRAAGIGVNVHYIPIHLQPYYRQLGFKPGDFPAAEHYYSGALTLPLFPGLTLGEQDQVIAKLREFLCA